MTLAHPLVTQIAYAFAAAITSADSGAMLSAPFIQQTRRAHLDFMDSNSAVAVGTVALFPATVAAPGYLKLNGALLSRTTYAAL